MDIGQSLRIDADPLISYAQNHFFIYKYNDLSFNDTSITVIKC